MSNNERASKEQYTKPSLTSVGDIKEITKGGGNSYSETRDMYTPPPPGDGDTSVVNVPPRE
jgi:hypothetical protein